MLLMAIVTVGKKKLCIIEVANSEGKNTNFPSVAIVCDLISTWLRGLMQCLYMRDP